MYHGCTTRKNGLARNNQLKKSPLKRSTKPLKRSPIVRKKRAGSKARIDYSLFAQPKIAKPIPVLWEYADGRIKYNRHHPQGAHLYESAKNLMADRQGWLCSICGEPMRQDELSFEHGNLRVAGKRNDDPNALDHEGYFWNSAAHGRCNGLRGSKRHEPYAIRLRPEAQQ